MSKEPNIEQIEEWAPHQQSWRACVGHMEREPGRLQLRVDLYPDEGVCTVLFEEDERAVTVLIVVCGEPDFRRDPVNCPVHIHLGQPLGERDVLDIVMNRRRVPHRNVYRELEREFDLPGF